MSLSLCVCPLARTREDVPAGPRPPNNIGADGALHLSSLSATPRLESLTLDLWRNNIRAQGAEHLGRFAAMPHLRHLSLGQADPCVPPLPGTATAAWGPGRWPSKPAAFPNQVFPTTSHPGCSTPPNEVRSTPVRLDPVKITWMRFSPKKSVFMKCWMRRSFEDYGNTYLRKERQALLHLQSEKCFLLYIPAAATSKGQLKSFHLCRNERRS